MSYVIYVATDSKSEGSYNKRPIQNILGFVATDGKSEGSYNFAYKLPTKRLLLLIVNQRVVTTLLLSISKKQLLLIVNQRVVTTKVSISQNMSNYNDD